MNATVFRRPAVVVLTGLLLATQSGCTSYRRGSPMSPEQSETLKIRLGAIGTVSARFQPNLVMKTPAKGAVDAAGKGAMGGAGAMLDASRGSGSGAIVGLLLTPVAAVAGGVGGAIMADSAKVVEGREATLKSALADMKVQEAMRDRFLAAAKARTSLRFEPVEAEGPVADGVPVDYRGLKAKGIDTVQETSVLSFGLDGEGKIQPDLYLRMRLRLRLVKTEDNSVLFDRTFVHIGPERKFAQWASEDAKIFREELERCYQGVAEAAVRDVYFLDALMR